ncbi:MAG: tetratricopeptide repeat protein, partial [Bacteroidales bacterium]
MSVLITSISTAQKKAGYSVEDGDFYFKNAQTYCSYNMFGEKYCKEAHRFYEAAIPHYERSLLSNTTDAALYFRLGICYMATQQPEKAIEMYKKALQLNPNVDVDALFFLARAQQHNAQWNEAKTNYQVLLNQLKNKEIKGKPSFTEAEIINSISQCTTGDTMVKREIKIKNLGKNINTIYGDYSPVISKSGITMLLTSRRPDFRLKEPDEDTIDFEADIANYIENIYITYYEKGQWQPIKRLGDIITVVGSHYASLDISDDASRMLVYRSSKGGDIYEATFLNGDWQGMQPLKGEVNTGLFEPTACYSPCGKFIYFASNRPGGYGGKDIYVASIDTNGVCRHVTNLGNVINTDKDEDGIFVGYNNNTIYFSSKGHYGIGGYDIFRSTRDGSGNWTKPVNMGYPINSAYDDIFYVQTADSSKAYFSSDRKGGIGRMDIYEITYKDIEQIAVKEHKTTVENDMFITLNTLAKLEKRELTSVTIPLKITVTEDQSNKPLSANVLVSDMKNRYILQTQNITGVYETLIPLNERV